VDVKPIEDDAADDADDDSGVEFATRGLGEDTASQNLHSFWDSIFN